MFEVHTNNGYRKFLNSLYVVEFAELSDNSRSNCVIIMSNLEKVFVAEKYAEVKLLYMEAINAK